MTRLAGILACVLATLVFAEGRSAAAEQQQIRILTALLDGDSSVVAGVSNLLRLQISSTFQEAGTPTRAVMIFDDDQWRIGSHRDAVEDALAADVAAQLVLWGKAYPMADGVVVTTFLSVSRLIDRRYSPELYTLTVPTETGAKITLGVGLPRDLFAYPPILISSDAATAYQKISELPVYADRKFTRQIGVVGPAFRAVAYFADAAQITFEGGKGWVNLSSLPEEKEQNLVRDFTGAIIRILRGDWLGAEQLLIQAKEDQVALPAELERDHSILMGLVAEKMGKSGLDHFRRAVSESPYDKNACAFLLLGLATRATQHDRQAAKELKDRIDSCRILFSPGSKWIDSLSRVASENAG